MTDAATQNPSAPPILGIWLILGNSMGGYLPHGSIIDWF